MAATGVAGTSRLLAAEEAQENRSVTNAAPKDQATHRAVQDGRWDDPAVWENDTIPGDDARVLIEETVTVTIAHEATEARIGWLRVEGTLQFDPTVDTHLQVDTIVTSPNSRLYIGTPATPIAPDVEARLSFIDTGPIDDEQDPQRLGRGLIAHGDIAIHGAAKTSWSELASHPVAGDRELELPEVPTHWQVGDRVAVPGTEPNEDQDDLRRIETVDGTTVTLDEPLAHDHVPPAADLDAYVLNLSRNVVLTSEEQSDVRRRGHVMVVGTKSDVRYALFDGLGRTAKDRPVTNPVRGAEYLSGDMEPNPRARYPLHYHKTGIGTDPHHTEGVVVDGSPGWGVVNHHAHAEVTDSITYDVLGAGFVSEGGNERGAYRRCFALRSEGSGDVIDSRAAGDHGGDPPIDDFGHAGHGFWMQSPLVEVTDCVAAGHRHQAFVWWLRPLLDGDLAEGTTINDSRVTFHSNLPWEYCNTDRPLFEAIKLGRFANGRNNDLMVDTKKIPSTFADIKKIQGNEAFASAGGMDFSRLNFKWKHERFSGFNVVDDMTVHSIGPFIDSDGNRHEPDLPRHRSSGPTQGRGGSTGVSFRYTSNVTLKNSRIIGTGRDNSVGVPFHDYRWTNTVENCTVENWDWGVDTGEHRLSWVLSNTLRNNTYDVNWGFNNAGSAILESNDLNLVRHDVNANIKSSEMMAFHRTWGLRVDGRTAYVAESAPDNVPFPTEDDLDYVNNWHYVIDDETQLVGLTNAEIYDQFGLTFGGGKPMPEDLVSEPFMEDSYLNPADESTPSDSIYLDSTNASSLGAWEVVDEPDASNDECLRWTGSSSPSDNFASIDFDCQSGTYRVWARVWPDSWNGDEAYFRIDGGSWKKARKFKDPKGFQWFDVSPHQEPPHEWNLSDGSHTLDFYTTNGDVKLDEIFIVEQANAEVLGAYGMSASGDSDSGSATEQEPYTDHDLSQIEAEDFDIGGEGVAYHDTSDGNKGGAYRDTDVDIQEADDTSGEYNVGWIRKGEWLEYTVDVPEAGEYDLRARLAGKNGTSLEVAVDGVGVATIDVPDTGGWQEWTTVDAGSVSLERGTHIIRLTADGDDFNLNWIGFT